MSETAKVTATLIGLPLLGVLLAILYLTPRYIPSEALARAAVDAGAGERGRVAVGRTLRRCRQGIELKPERLGVEAMRVYSWENDAGLAAVTDVDCRGERQCVVGARALLPRPTGMRLWGCHRRGRSSLFFDPPV